MNPAEDVRLVPATEHDESFLFGVFASSRAPELSGLPSVLLRMQFEAQDKGYRSKYPRAQFLLVYHKDRPAGRLYLDEGESEIHVLDIALLPEFRGKGLGASLLRSVMARAAASQRTVGLQVAQHNPARRLYERLGFVPLSEDEMYVRMQWRPATAP